MEQALTLVATNTLTITMACNTPKNKLIPLPLTLNLSTGKELTRQTGFRDAAWGKVTHGYISSICTLSDAKFVAIVTAAQPFMKQTCTHNRKSGTMEIINVDADSERACLVDNSDLDSESDSDHDGNVSIFFLFTNFANMIF